MSLKNKSKMLVIKDIAPLFLSSNQLETVYGLGDYIKFWKFYTL